MKNGRLREEIKSIVKNKSNILEVYKGVTNEQPTIVIAEKEPLSYGSFLYNTESERNSDLEALESLLK